MAHGAHTTSGLLCTLRSQSRAVVVLLLVAFQASAMR